MTVGLSWGSAGKDDKKKTVTEPGEVAVSVPTKRRNMTGGALAVTVGAVMMVAAVLGVSAYLAYWGIEAALNGGREKSCGVKYEEDEAHLYDRPFRGQQPNDDYKFEEHHGDHDHADHHEGHQGEYDHPHDDHHDDDEEWDWELWGDMVGNEDFDPEEVRMVEEWFKVEEGVWMVDVVPWMAQPILILTDTVSDYTVVKTDLLDGAGVRCMVLHSDILAPLMEPIQDFVNDDESNFINVNSIVTEFWALGERVEDHHEIGSAIREVCAGVSNFHFLENEEVAFRAEVAHLMEEHEVTYDDMYDWFMDTVVALEDGDDSAVEALLAAFNEVIGFLPDGSYSGHLGTEGMGWSLNVRTRPYTYNTEITYFDFAAYEAATEQLE
jgi:hypothetical protein